MPAMIWRLAAAFSNVQVGIRFRLARISEQVITGNGPLPWPRAA